jgi:hypothetical protein
MKVRRLVIVHDLSSGVRGQKTQQETGHRGEPGVAAEHVPPIIVPTIIPEQSCVV